MYRLELVCQVLEFPRSTLSAQQAREINVVPLHSKRRGPKPKMSDASLLGAIRTDLEASTFVGEGHRKVWARLRILNNIPVSKDRVCRLMRENALLLPHRVRQGAPSLHDGSFRLKRQTRCGVLTAFASRSSKKAGCGCSLPSIISMPTAWASTQSKSVTALPPCSRMPRDFKPALAPPAPMPARGSNCGWITVRNTPPTTS